MKKLIIVCEEKLRHYGDFLAQLISRSDDSTETVIGIKDGTTAAQVWTEKEYVGNAAQISSEQYILFIGNSKLIKDKRLHMQQVFSQYGMNYGWLGKQAVLFVDYVISLAEYENFYQLASSGYSKGNQPELARLFNKKADAPALPEPVIEVADDIENTSAEEPCAEEQKGIKKLVMPLASAKKVIKKVADQGEIAAAKLSDNISKAVKSKDIENQEYSCLIVLFYLNGLSSFLGLSEG